jgi:amino acid adenylation domain-containing protein
VHTESSCEFPLSAAQRGVWLALQMHRSNLSYCLWDYVPLYGIENSALLIEAIKLVCESSPNLSLVLSGNTLDPRQRLSRHAPVDVPFIDVSATNDPKEQALQWIKCDAATGIDPCGTRLYRMAVLRLSPGTLYWYRHYHHLVVDGYSTMLLGMWTAEAYKSLCSGRGHELRTAYRSYDEYLGFESQYRRSPQFAHDRAYWAEVYRELPKSVTLAVRAKASESSRAVNVSGDWLPSELWMALHALARALEVSVSHVLIAAVVIYIHRATGELNIPIGVPTHGRTQGETLDMAGMCTNILPFCFCLDPVSALGTAILAISAVLATGMLHRRYRQEELGQGTHLTTSGASPFRINANVIRSVGTWPFAQCPVRAEPGGCGPVEDLTFMIVESTSERRFRLTILSNPLLYEDWEIAAHREYFVSLLCTISQSPDKQLRDISLTEFVEQRDIAQAWTGKNTLLTQDQRCLHWLFQEQVAKTPWATAVIDDHGPCTYSALNERSNRLANYLRAAGVNRGDIVGLCVDRSVEMIVGILAILKAGGAYLPLDSQLPPSRLEYMVMDAGATIIVTQLAHELALPDHLSRLVFLDAIQPALRHHEHSDLHTDVQPRDLAYVIYTSGSTGVPKGVLVQHSCVCNLVTAQRCFLSLAVGNRVLQFARLSFDVSVSEIAAALSCGATLVIPNQSALLLETLPTTIRRSGVDVISVPPSALLALRGDIPTTLRTIIVAGEVCPVEFAKELSRDQRFINAYGPTEATVYATYYEYRGGDSLPIGRPMKNVEAYILGPNLEQVPVGLIGELYIGGAGIAQGYLRRSELTAAMFVPNPFVFDSDARLYRTGDLARWLPDGNIDYVGRRDQQVKLRGFRIELGEVEAAIAARSNVRECAVNVYESGHRKQLVAYVVLRQPGVPTGELRNALRDVLPEYMIPSVIVPLHVLPRTPSGKIDRRHLPPPSEYLSARVFVEPVSSTEREVAAIWCDVLQLDRVGRCDSFFEVGGDSLAALAFVVETSKRFNIELSPHALYETATLKELAAVIDGLATSSHLVR